MTGPTQAASDQIVPILQGYKAEAEQARKGGLNPRDEKWEENLNLYWNRYSFGDKAAWQAKETLPEVPAFVDRFAAALKEALISGPESFYTIHDPSDAEGDLTDAIKKGTDVWLSMSGRNQTGTCLGFPAVFEEQVKLGALMAMSSVVLWKNDVKYGRVAIETVDPRNIYLDHTYRNLYRVRTIELDKHELRKMVTDKDKKGKSIWNADAVEQMVSHIELEAAARKEGMTGHGVEQTSSRQPITMDEYIATVVGNDGRVIAENALMVVGNGQFLIRGPEKNPFWHKKDWLVYAPLVTVPLSVYGRSYMEDFGGIARVFNNLTNLILDAVQMSTMKAYAVVPEMLLNPEQLAEGITPNKLFQLEGGFAAKDFLSSIDLGNLPPESLTVWSQMKGELREAADMNEVGLGQFAPKGRTSASEINQTQESSSALIRSVAQTVEARWLDPTLDLTWQTGLQHARPDDTVMANAMGPELYRALMARRKELIARPVTFQARGISTLIQKGRMLRALLQVMQYLAQSPDLLAAFMQKVDMEKFVKYLFRLSDIDMSKVTISDRQLLVKNAVAQMQQGAQNAGAAGLSPSPAAQNEGGELANMLGAAQ